MQKNSVIAGIDIGGTNTVLGFIDSEGQYLLGDSIPTSSHEDAEIFISRIVFKLKEILKPYKNQYNIKGIGVAAPNANYFSGTIEIPSNLKWRNVNFINILKKHIDVPAVIVNDANAAALGELYYGQAKGMKNFIEITLGTGLGSGIIIDGNLLLGVNGFAGEIGHIIVSEDGRMCNCGRTGCLETYASANGIRRTSMLLLGEMNVESEMRNIPFDQLDGKAIDILARKGDPVALRAFEFTGEILGKALANVALCYSPEAIILFGGLAEAGDLLLNPVRTHFEKNLLNIHKDKIKILKSELQDGKAAVLGAASLILKRIYNYSSELKSAV